MIRGRVDHSGGSAREHYEALADRCRVLKPIAPEIIERLKRGNREARLAGVDAQGTPFVPLKPSTLKGKRRPGPALDPGGESGRIITDYRVDVSDADGKLVMAPSWPSLSGIIRYFQAGTPRMARRDPTGFRPIDVKWIKDRMRQFILKGK